MDKPDCDVYDPKCPTCQVLDRIADRWTALIVGLLAQRPHRFGELRRGVRGISQKVLSQTLQSLERDGLVRRRPLATVPPTVEYLLTSLGRTLDEPLASIRSWAECHIDDMQTARGAYLRPAPAAAATTPRVPPRRPSPQRAK